MREVVKYERRGTQNMEMTVEVLRNSDIGLNAASLRCPLGKYT
jgi:hypothetical protein